MKKRLIPIWKPKWSEPCPCASTKKYRDCCRRRLPGFDIGKAYSKALEEKNLDRAIIAARADITQYTIWHKSNTAPMLARGGPALKMLRIDVNALGDYVGRLSVLYYRLGLWDDWLAALDRLSHNIAHPAWQRKIAYHRAVSHLSPEGDRIEARREMAKLGRISKSEDDLDILHLYVDLEFDDLPFAERIAILDRILALSGSRQNQLQYSCGRAMQYFLIGDTTTAKQQLIELVAAVRANEEADPLEGYERHLFGALLQLLGSLTSDDLLLRESVDQFQMLLDEGDWTETGKARLQREIGDSYRYAGELELAVRAYRDALAFGGTDINNVSVAECLRRQGNLQEATKAIDSVDRTTLDRREADDFAFEFASIAIALKQLPRLNEAKVLLQRQSTQEPIFNERRLSLAVRVTEAMMAPADSTKQKSNPIAKEGVATASSFLLLQPNIFGIGVNFNSIFDYFARKKPDGSKD